jgi:hypothetical protein
MKLLIDMNLSPAWVAHLEKLGKVSVFIFSGAYLTASAVQQQILL